LEYGKVEDSCSNKSLRWSRRYCFRSFRQSQIRNVQVIDNPAASYNYGSGLVAVKTLADLKVDFVFAAGLGLGTSGLLGHHHITKISVKPDMKIADAIKGKLAELKV